MPSWKHSPDMEPERWCTHGSFAVLKETRLLPQHELVITEFKQDSIQLIHKSELNLFGQHTQRVVKQ